MISLQKLTGKPWRFFSKWANEWSLFLWLKKVISKESLVVDKYIVTESAKG